MKLFLFNLSFIFMFKPPMIFSGKINFAKKLNDFINK